MEHSTVTVKRDPVQIQPDRYKVLMENDRVRVLDITLDPGEISPEHSHPPLVIYVLDDLRAKISLPDGTSDVVELKKGEAIWADAVTHAVENVGSRQLRVLNIELKEPEED